MLKKTTSFEIPKADGIPLEEIVEKTSKYTEKAGVHQRNLCQYIHSTKERKELFRYSGRVLKHHKDVTQKENKEPITGDIGHV